MSALGGDGLGGVCSGGCLLQEGVCSGGYLLLEMCLLLGDVCLGGVCLGGVCLGGVCSWGSLLLWGWHPSIH